MFVQLQRLDAECFLRINAHAGSGWDYLFGWTTHLGTPVLYGVVLVLLLIWDRDKLASKMAAIVAAGVGASYISHLLKDHIDRARPYAYFTEQINQGRVDVHTLFNTFFSNSFPSGHATFLFAVAAALNSLYRHRLWWLYPLAAVLALTRVYVGAHFPSDVIAGAVVGTAVGLWVTYLMKKVVLKESLV